jgi:metal-dependent HD superfamily phosphatase/phosphodiesterase
MRSTLQFREHPLGVGQVVWLADDLAMAQHDSVDAQHRSAATSNGASLANRVLDRITSRRLVEVRCNDVERKVELRQDRATLRRR